MLLPNEYHSYFKIYIDDLASNGKSIIENLIETGNHLEQFATTISKEKVTESTNKNSSENDVWNNTNSEFEVSNSDAPKLVSQNKEKSRKKIQEPFSIASLIALILSPFTPGLGFLLALIFSIKSMSRFRKNPEKYKGKTLARIVFGICLAAYLIVISAVAIFLALW